MFTEARKREASEVTAMLPTRATLHVQGLNRLRNDRSPYYVSRATPYPGVIGGLFGMGAPYDQSHDVVILGYKYSSFNMLELKLQVFGDLARALRGGHSGMHIDQGIYNCPLQVVDPFYPQRGYQLTKWLRHDIYGDKDIVDLTFSETVPPVRDFISQ